MLKQLIDEKVGQLDSLSTEEKSTVVAAINEVITFINKNLITTSNNVYTSGTLKDVLNSLDLSKNITTFSVSNEVDGVPDGNGWYNMLVFNKSYEYMMIAINTWQPYHMWFTSFHFSDNVLYLGKWIRLVELEEIVNPNILINSNFKINQRGQQEYRGNNIYAIDRWMIWNAALFPREDGINIVINNAGYYELKQFIEIDVKNFAGKSITGSICVDGVVYSLTYDLPKVIDVQIETTKKLFENFHLRLGINPFTQVLYFWVFNEGEGSYVINWAKLELGKIPTSFVPPNQAEELVKCQRYYETGTCTYALSVDHLLPDYVQGVNFKVNKRVVPSIKIIDSLGNPEKVTDVQQNGYDVVNKFVNEYGIQDVVITPALELNRGVFYKFIADAEIY